MDEYYIFAFFMAGMQIAYFLISSIRTRAN